MAQSYRADCPPRPMRCVLIADDLTGACDAAAPFRAQGASVRVHLDFEYRIVENRAAPYADIVVAFSTDSRDVSSANRQDSLCRVASQVRTLRPDIVFKKIDSTLRGSPGEEIAAARDAFACEVAVITPAFPDMGRRVRAGYLHSDRDPAWEPIHIQTLLRTQSLHDCHHVSPHAVETALARGFQVISVDAVTNEDLEMVVTQALRCGRRVLWAGSAGLAGALARALFPGDARQSLPPARRVLPVLLIIGSNHVVTSRQVVELSNRFRIQHLEANSATPESVAASLHSGRHTILAVDRNTTSSEHLRMLLGSSAPLMSALLLSGGDTASLLCRAIGARAIALEGEIVTGLPWGILEGGLLSKLLIVTKSGAFGSPDALTAVADFFSCPAS